MGKILKPATVQDLLNRVPSESTVVRVQSWQPLDVLTAAHDYNIHHIVQSDNPLLKVDKNALKIMQANPAQFFDEPWSLWTPSSSYVDDQLLTIDIHQDDKKSDILARIETFLGKDHNTRKVRHEVLLLSDELFVNVRNATGLKNQVKGSLFVLICRSHIVLGSLDGLGQLNPTDIIQNALRCYRDGVINSIRQDTKGAGIGSYYMFEYSTTMALGVIPGRKTVVCLILPLKINESDDRTMNKNLHWLVFKRG